MAAVLHLPEQKVILKGSWRHHPVFHGLPIREVIVWLRGEDSDV